MRSILVFTFVLGFIPINNLSAQERITASPENWTAYNGEVTFEEGTIHLKNKGNGSALLWLKDMNFKNGIVELDVKGKDVRGQSFIGLAFHGLDNLHYDAVYFRPFNFKSSEKRNNAVQYINAPDNVWHVLRKKFPGKYENAALPVTDPNDWFHVTVEINSPNVKVYINGSDVPTLDVKKISNGNEGKLGLWIDSEDGRFKNITVHKTQ